MPPSARWRASLDSYRFDVQSASPPIRARASDHLASPSLSLIYGPWQSAEVYANVGSGFHSNDARGTVITIDPKTGLAADKVQPLVRSRHGTGRTHGMAAGLADFAVPVSP
jgi:outer membrane receptor for Fe3+-dicitrate